MKKIFPTLSIFVILCCLATRPILAQEKQKEHPEHPTSQKKVSLEEIDKAIRAHIDEVAKASGGRFPVKDEVLNKTWQLELVRVHKDRLQALADGSYFACVDFRAEDGTMVDVDFFLKKKGSDLVVTDTTVHKVNGKPRYSYEEKNGVWVKVPEKNK